MALSRYNPYGMSLRNAMDQLLTQAFVNPSMFMGPQSMVAPMNVYETNNGYEVQVALAGVKPQDIDLTVQQNTLDIKGKFSYTMPQTTQSQQAGNVVESQPGQQSRTQQTQQSQSQQAQQSQSQQAQSQQGQANFTTLVQEIPMGNFERTITFPRAIDANQIHTSFENGILTIWVPVSEASRARKISVHSGQSSQSSQSSQPQHVSVSQS